MAKKSNQRNQESSMEKPPLDLVTQFLENQTIELKNAAEEIELRKLNEQNAFNYGCKALEAQKEDRKDQRAQTTLFMKYGFWLTIFILILGAIFVGSCIYTGNVDIIVSILKVIAYIIPSVIGGYFIGLNKGKKSASTNQPTYAEIIED